MKLQDRGSANKYEQLSDEELIDILREGDSDVCEYLLDKYKNLVRSRAANMHILGADSEDLIQEGMIGLYKAIRDYDSGRDASFFTFAELCVVRQIYSAVTASRRQKHMPLNSYISFYSDAMESSDGKRTPSLEETLSDNPEDNPEAIIIDRENVEAIEKWIDTELSVFERECIELYMTGMPYTEIARILNKDEKSTDNALNRAKSKLKKKFGK